MASQMGPTPFFYYTPDPNPENRHHGHFSQQQPSFQQMQQQQVFPVVPTLPSTPIYSRPNSSCSQQPMSTKIFNSVPSNMTPMASPQATQRPGILVQGNHPSKLMLETELCDNDGFYYPATPPLSTSGSSMGSPCNTNDMLATPLNPMFSGLDGCEMVKPEVEAPPENLENLDWASCGSPPLTPGRFGFSFLDLTIVRDRVGLMHLIEMSLKPISKNNGLRRVIWFRADFGGARIEIHRLSSK